MKKTFLVLLAVICCNMLRAEGFDAAARWISANSGEADEVNTWVAFRKDVSVDKVPSEVLASISADSKYWLWINGKQVVFEGQLKRGPNKNDTYYDEVDLARYLKKGNNQIALLLWYFGKSGFSHLSSGKSGVIVSAPSIGLHSDASWLSRIHPAYGTCGDPEPNFRLSESSIRYDGNKDMGDWQTKGINELNGFCASKILGSAGDAPWNQLVKRLTPQWKNYGLTTAKYQTLAGTECDTLVVSLPCNIHITPAFSLSDETGGHVIKMETDHVKGGGEWGVRAEYVTRAGQQTYESLGWMNGEKIRYIVPHGIKVKKLMYRQTGYNGEPEGTFVCDDAFFNKFWEKGLRTLYVNMRDTYFDCPDRERAQWWGDASVLMGECFYTYSTSVHQLMKKAILELCHWRKDDNTIYSPIPGNYGSELPAQMLASVGLYGFWNYYMNTGDKETLAEVYPYVCDYLDVWKTDETGLTAERHGGWDWGDWGDNRDIRLIYAGWHYMALDAASRMADELGKNGEARDFRKTMEKVKDGYNKCWNGTAYRHPGFNDDTDDRVQALAVLSGIAESDKYDQITQLLHTQKHASPYMEKYVMESLFKMNQGEYAMERVRERFDEMVSDPNNTTLYEGWGIGANGYGGGTTNHAWSGGSLTVISQCLMGIRPVKPGWKRFEINPQFVRFQKAAITVPTILGTVGTSFRKANGKTEIRVTVPQGSEALLYLPVKSIHDVSGKIQYQTTDQAVQKEGKVCLLLPEGKYKYTF